VGKGGAVLIPLKFGGFGNAAFFIPKFSSIYKPNVKMKNKNDN